MSDQVQVDLIVKAMATGFDSVNNTFTELKSKFDLASQALQAVGTAFKKAYEFAKEGAEIELTAWRFDRLTESIGTTSEAIMGDLETSTAGLLSQSQTMKLATDMMALGLANSADQVVRLSGVSAQLGMDVGEMTLALTNQTTRRFDQLGVSTVGFEDKLKALKDQGMDTNEAFTEAFLQQAEEQIERVGSIADTTAGQFKTLESNAADLLDTLKQLASTGAEPTVKKMNTLTGAAADGAKNLLNLSKVLDSQSMSFKDLTAIMLNHIFGVESLWDANDRLTASIEFLQGPLGPLAPMFEAASNAAGGMGDALEESATQVTPFIATAEQIASATATIRDRANEAATAQSNLAIALMGLDAAGIAKMQIDEFGRMLDNGVISSDQYTEAVKQISIDAGLASEQTWALTDGISILSGLIKTGQLDVENYTSAWDVAAIAAQDGELSYKELTDALEAAGLAAQTQAEIINEMNLEPAAGQASNLALQLAAIDAIPENKTWNFRVNVTTTGPVNLLTGGGMTFGGGNAYGNGSMTGFGPGFANGGSFDVPPQYINDSFPMRVDAGEHVEVTPANQTPRSQQPIVVDIDYYRLAQAITESMDKSAMVR